MIKIIYDNEKELVVRKEIETDTERHRNQITESHRSAT